MESIVVCDDFLTREELNEVTKIIADTKWSLESFHLEETPYWYMNLSENSYISNYLKSVIEKYFSKKFVLKTVYCNGRTFGQDGIYVSNSEEKQYMFTLFLTKMKESDIDFSGGYLCFKLPNYKYNICYEPVFNRGLFYPSNIMNKNTAFERFFMDMRTTVTWVLEEL